MREQALALLRQYNESEALVQHGREVGAILEHFAQKAGEDPDYWGSVGLLHDVDYEKYPEEHCKKAVDILKDAGYDEAFIHGVVSHGYGLVCDVEPELYMEKVLYTIDELERAHPRGGADAAVQIGDGFGGKEPEEEIQGQALCRRGEPGGHYRRVRSPGAGAGPGDGGVHRGPAGAPPGAGAVKNRKKGLLPGGSSSFLFLGNLRLSRRGAL